MSKNEIATISKDLPAYLEGKTEPILGNENVGMEDSTVPRLDIVQSLSPCAIKGTEEYIPGAEPGLLMNSVSRQLYGTEVYVIFAAYEVEFLLWRSRKTHTGGFFGKFKTKPEAAEALSKLDPVQEAPGVDIFRTPQHYGLILDFSDKENVKAEPIHVSMGGLTKIKVSKRLNTLIKMIGQSRYTMLFRLFTVLETNKKNEKYQNFDFEHVGYVTEEMSLEGKKIYDMMEEGKLKTSVDFDEQESKEEY